MKDINTKDFLKFIIQSGSMLCWKKSNNEEIVFLNNIPPQMSGLDIDIGQLLQNLVKAQQIVVEEDFFRFKLFIQSMRAGEAASVIFRVRDKHDCRCWWKIGGAPGTEAPNDYYGYLQDITENAAFINQLLEKDLTRQTMIETDDYPVLLVDMESKAVISRNTATYHLFGYTYYEFNRMKFQDLYPPENASRAAKVYETCLLEGTWEGKFILVKKGNIPFEARVKIRRLSLRERNLLRISVYETMAADGEGPEKSILQPTDREQYEQILLTAVAGKNQIEDVLEALLKQPYGEPLFDAIMYADVQPKKGKVDLYARGDAFKNLKPGTTYDYEGTISQLMGEKQPPFVILEDTLASTKTIDWALFIPHGIRSYFVKPFYHGGKLRSLLILCSTQANRFSEARLDLYEVFSPAFLKGLRNWRKGKKTSSPPYFF